MAIQVGESFSSYGKNPRLQNCVFFGGVPQKSQVDALKAGVDILTATPGRFLDLMNQKVISIKEVRLSATIEEHDFNVKVKSAYKFLQDGDKVKVSIRFRGREMKYTVAGKEVLEKFAIAVNDVGIAEKQPKLEGKSMLMILNPNKK